MTPPDGASPARDVSRVPFKPNRVIVSGGDGDRDRLRAAQQSLGLPERVVQELRAVEGVHRAI